MSTTLKCSQGRGEDIYRAEGGISAIQEFEDKYHIPVISIVTVDEIVKTLRGKEIKGKVIVDDNMVGKIAEYYQKWSPRR